MSFPNRIIIEECRFWLFTPHFRDKVFPILTLSRQMHRLSLTTSRSQLAASVLVLLPADGTCPLHVQYVVNRQPGSRTETCAAGVSNTASECQQNHTEITQNSSMWFLMTPHYFIIFSKVRFRNDSFLRNFVPVVAENSKCISKRQCRRWKDQDGSCCS